MTEYQKTDTFTTLDMIYLEAVMGTIAGDHRNIVLARAYHEGFQPVYMNERSREYLDLHVENQFHVNICRVIVNVLRDELTVVGFDTAEKPDKEGVKEQAAWFWEMWGKNKMDVISTQTHEYALRDRESFIILDWDEAIKFPSLTLHERYTLLEANAWQGRWPALSQSMRDRLHGTGAGVWMVYENDDPNQKPRFAVKQWTQESVRDGRVRFDQRRTIYYPDRIERWILDGGWKHYLKDGETEESWPQKWVDKKGKPLGIPVIHFKNENLTPEHWDAIPLQDVVNKTMVDILGAADLTGFRSFFAFGWYPTTDGETPRADGSNWIKFGPGQINGSMKGADQASVTPVDGADPTPLMDILKDVAVIAAQITSTPASKFVTTAAIASSETLKEQDRALKRKATNRKMIFGDAWEECMLMARRIANAFSSAILDENVEVEAIWKASENFADLIDEKALGVPVETIWAEMGKTPDQIATMKQTLEYRIAFEKALWEGAAAATQSIPLSVYLKRVGLSDKDIKAITAGIAGDEAIPPTGL
jgi:hypothetical protein